MRSGTIAFLAGVLLLQQCARLPSIYWCWLLAPALMALRWPWLRLPAALLAGTLWALLHGAVGLRGDLPAACEGEDLDAGGVVVSIPQSRARGTRFLYRIDALAGCPEARLPLRARLGWYDQPGAVAAGERWTLRLRLKRRNGFLNPGGFDYERWLFQRGIGALGYVRPQGDHRALGAAGDAAARWAAIRQDLHDRVVAATPDADHRGVLLALTLGERAMIPGSQWEVFTRTGTGHLLAISGLHIGLIAGLGLLCGSWLWRRSAWLSTRLPAAQAGVLTGLGLAILYAALAGFALPTLRAVLMLAVACGALLLRRQVAPSRTLAAALLAVLLVDPTAVLATAFWLSFTAVAVLIFGMSHRLGPGGWWWRWGRAQWLVGLGLMPLSLALFQQAALVGPLANLVAVPWVGLLVTPLALAGAVLAPLSDTLAGWLLGAADGLLGWLWPLLDWLSAAQISTVRISPTAIALVLGLLGVALALAPRGLPGRPLAMVLLLPLLGGARPALEPGQTEVLVLDVGQGLATVVRTGTRVLVYDTGPRYSEAFDAGSGVVAPYLRTLGVRHIDRLIVSHGDNDHSGGYPALAAAFSVGEVLAGEPEAIGPEARPCRAGQSWRWLDTQFTLLHPPLQHGRLAANDRSCVLRIHTAGGRVLLTGDLQRRGEALLLAAAGAAELDTDVLVAPHHGSATSSTDAFVQAARPRWVLFATGYRNRFGFPRPEVSARYAASGARLAETASCGAIRVRLDARRSAPQVDCYREAAARYWNRR